MHLVGSTRCDHDVGDEIGSASLSSWRGDERRDQRRPSIKKSWRRSWRRRMTQARLRRLRTTHDLEVVEVDAVQKSGIGVELTIPTEHQHPAAGTGEALDELRCAIGPPTAGMGREALHDQEDPSTIRRQPSRIPKPCSRGAAQVAREHRGARTPVLDRLHVDTPSSERISRVVECDCLGEGAGIRVHGHCQAPSGNCRSMSTTTTTTSQFVQVPRGSRSGGPIATIPYRGSFTDVKLDVRQGVGA